MLLRKTIFYHTHKKRENSKVILPFNVWKVFSGIPWLAVAKNEVCDNIT